MRREREKKERGGTDERATKPPKKKHSVRRVTAWGRERGAGRRKGGRTKGSGRSFFLTVSWESSHCYYQLPTTSPAYLAGWLARRTVVQGLMVVGAVVVLFLAMGLDEEAIAEGGW